MNINLHIERLILDGLPIETRHRVELQAAIETELARLLTGNELSPQLDAGSSRAVPGVRAASIQLAAQVTPAQLGRQIADSIYGSIGKTK